MYMQHRHETKPAIQPLNISAGYPSFLDCLPNKHVYKDSVINKCKIINLFILNLISGFIWINNACRCSTYYGQHQEGMVLNCFYQTYADNPLLEVRTGKKAGEQQQTLYIPIKKSFPFPAGPYYSLLFSKNAQMNSYQDVKSRTLNEQFI